MSSIGKTLGRWIDDLARRTAASPMFVEKVRSYFLAKGLSMEQEAGNYAPALEVAFLRQEAVRTGIHPALQIRLFTRQPSAPQDAFGLPAPLGAWGSRTTWLPGVGRIVMVPGPEESQ